MRKRKLSINRKRKTEKKDEKMRGRRGGITRKMPYLGAEEGTKEKVQGDSRSFHIRID